jgi:hypothetical protein
MACGYPCGAPEKLRPSCATSELDQDLRVAGQPPGRWKHIRKRQVDERKWNMGGLHLILLQILLRKHPVVQCQERTHALQQATCTGCTPDTGGSSAATLRLFEKCAQSFEFATARHLSSDSEVVRALW